MLTRRACVTSLTLSALASAAIRAQDGADTFNQALTRVEGQAPTSVAGNEVFWSAVRARFEVAPENANFVTVVHGVAPRSIRERVAQEYERLNTFRLGGVSNTERKTAARRKAAAFIGAADDTAALVRNTTEGVTTVLMNWPLQRGDEILTSSAEHAAFYDTLAARAARDGISVRRFHYPVPAPLARCDCRCCRSRNDAANQSSR